MNNYKKEGIDVVQFGDLWGCDNCNYKLVLGLGSMILGMDIANPEEWLKKYYWIEVKR